MISGYNIDMMWSKPQINYLKENFPIKSDLELARCLNKFPNTVRIKVPDFCFYLHIPAKDTENFPSLFAEFDVPQYMRYKLGINPPTLEA